MRPFLKWAGNKYRLVKTIVPLLPEGKRLVEPFTGSAAIFLNSDYKRALLAETNQDLINLYNKIKSDADGFIADSRKWFQNRYNDPDQYYRLRALFNETEDDYLKATLFIYLNRHGFNGLCRYNQRGAYNVPFGRYVKPYFPEEQLYFFAEKAKRASLVCSSFEETMLKAKPGDVVYCDPPYVPISNTSNFTQYHHASFGEEAQHRLAELARELSRRGIPVVISNHDTPLTRTLYKNASCHYFSVQRSISCNGNKRIKVREVLAIHI